MFDRLRRSLTLKLLLFTIVAVLIVEIVLLIPSVSKFRIDWLDDRIEAAYLLSSALESADDMSISEDTARMLFSTAGIRGLTIDRGEVRELVLDPEIDAADNAPVFYVDTADRMPLKLMADAWGTMLSSGDALIQVHGRPEFASAEMVDIIVSRRALRADMLGYTSNILILSLIISTATAALLFYALNGIIVRPVGRLTRAMMRFESDPERYASLYRPSPRRDEIGVAERSLAAMQRRISSLLSERRRLAALGAGISKISHDLKNILASAQLMSDRLAKSDDPAVKKLSPRLISALDRAISLSRDTLAFGAMSPDKLRIAPTPLHALCEEVLADSAAIDVDFRNQVSPELRVDADRTQLYRALFNLARNAVEAMRAHPRDEARHQLTLDAQVDGARVLIEVIDTGPGVPAEAKKALFEPFQGSLKPGGSGLGVAIAAEIAHVHGGALTLVKSDERGAHFRIALPQRSPLGAADHSAGKASATTPVR